MSTKHTPGPWIAIHSIPEEGSECFWLRAQPGGTICRGFSQEIGTINGPQSGEQEANARLIAAAPELLEACQAMVEWDDREKDHAVDFSARIALCEVAFEKARAAIVKATGSAA